MAELDVFSNNVSRANYILNKCKPGILMLLHSKQGSINK